MRVEPSRAKRHIAVASLLLLGVLAAAWTLRALPERESTAAQPERAEPTPEPAAEVADLAREERAPLLELRAESAPTHATAVLADTPPTPTLASAPRTNVRVRVLGIEAGERAVVEARVYGEPENGAHLVRELDEHGELALALPPGQLRLGAWTETKIAPPLLVQLGTEPASFELQLARAALVTGRVTNALTGAPIEGARVTLMMLRELDAELSGPDGRYELAVLADGIGRPLRCEADGYAREETITSAHADGRWDARSPAQIPLDRQAPHRDGPPVVDFALLPSRTITGELHGAQGALAGASVAALGHFFTATGLAFPDEAKASSEESGEFALHGLRPDIDHFVTVTLPGYAELRVRVPPSSEPQQELGRLQLQTACALEARVLDADEVPVEDVSVVLAIPLVVPQDRRIPTQDEFPRNALRFAYMHEGRRVRTDADGVARFEALAPGVRSIHVAGSAADAPASKPLPVDVGAEPRVELRVTGTARMTGHALADGKPVAGARVSLREGAHRGTLSQSDGSFRFAGLDPARGYTLEASWTDAQGVTWSCESTPADWREQQVLVLRAP